MASPLLVRRLVKNQAAEREKIRVPPLQRIQVLLILPRRSLRSSTPWHVTVLRHSRRQLTTLPPSILLPWRGYWGPLQPLAFRADRSASDAATALTRATRAPPRLSSASSILPLWGQSHPLCAQCATATFAIARQCLTRARVPFLMRKGNRRRKTLPRAGAEVMSRTAVRPTSGAALRSSSFVSTFVVGRALLISSRRVRDWCTALLSQ
mmetsp:Transcript_18757/g.40835  ORF Transcript_18757/g.40835 Transcript_18757/m.40835 type:complete len:209 (+) Transcript_18757:1074-1700(+)